MFPILLDDESLANEFQIFIEAVDDSHELTLGGHQQYPVWLTFVPWLLLSLYPVTCLAHFVSTSTFCSLGSSCIAFFEKSESTFNWFPIGRPNE